MAEFPDDVECEFCPDTMPDDDSATEAGWKEGWDGWACPECQKIPVVH